MNAEAQHNHAVTPVTTSTASTVLQFRWAAFTILRRSATPIGNLLPERMFFLMTCFLRLAEHLDRELSRALHHHVDVLSRSLGREAGTVALRHRSHSRTDLETPRSSSRRSRAGAEASAAVGDDRSAGRGGSGYCQLGFRRRAGVRDR